MDGEPSPEPYRLIADECLGQLKELLGGVQRIEYEVSSQSVSFHLPFHRILALLTVQVVSKFKIDPAEFIQ